MTDDLTNGFAAGPLCAICKGHANLPPWENGYCDGYRVEALALAFCRRVDLAGGLQPDSSGLFTHRLASSCECGQSHEASSAPSVEQPVNPPVINVGPASGKQEVVAVDGAISGPGSKTAPAKRVDRDTAWPSPAEPAAFHGLAGEIVKVIAPHTEADDLALLAQFLVYAGSAAGRNAFFLAESDRHYPNLYLTLVGTSSKGRKGTAAGQVRRIFEIADPQWTDQRIMSGLSSGEGLIWAVHDPIEKLEPIKEKGKVVEYQSVITEPGVADKRLLALEQEFSSVLKVLGREGNVLSAQVRNAWDSGSLRTLTKGSPTRATGAHISIIGHITRDELLRELNSTEAGNGFGNRFLWLCVKRSKVLPEGGNIPSSEIHQLGQQLRKSLEFARTAGELRRDEGARKLWRSIYEKLSEGRAGLFGAVTSRAEAQTMRLALVYALLDRQPAIRVEHLEAALALWRYAEDSARYIFGSSIGDTTADAIIAALRNSPEGMTKSQIYGLFSRHKPAFQVEQALDLLNTLGLSTMTQTPTAGRPAAVWRATSHPSN